MTANTDAHARRAEILDAIKNAIIEGYVPPSKGNSRSGKKTAYQRAAETLGVDIRVIIRGVYQSRLLNDCPDWNDVERTAEKIRDPYIEKPDLPSPDEPIEKLIETLTTRSDRILHANAARSWFKVKVHATGPFGVAWIGDPHMDSPGCNWRLLRRDVKIIRETPGLFAANCGDSIDNWWGRLMALKGKSFVTDEEAWRLVEWLIAEVTEEKWLLWLLGNHDTKNDTTHFWKRLCGNLIHMDDWQARFTLVPPNGRECRIWAAHNFPGFSLWNKTHGGQRAAALSGASAHIYVQGHHHEWQMMTTENPNRGTAYWVLKARGYKFVDEYGEQHGYFPQAGGATITSIIDPDSETEEGFVTCFSDLEKAASYLTYIREYRAKK